jgi:hypothetical protein
MEAAGSSVMLITTYQIILYHNIESHDLNLHCHKNLKYVYDDLHQRLYNKLRKIQPNILYRPLLKQHGNALFHPMKHSITTNDLIYLYSFSWLTLHNFSPTGHNKKCKSSTVPPFWVASNTHIIQHHIMDNNVI